MKGDLGQIIFIGKLPVELRAMTGGQVGKLDDQSAACPASTSAPPYHRSYRHLVLCLHFDHV